jgi:hypothetical protein
MTIAQAASHRLFTDVKAYEEDIYAIGEKQ